MDSITIVRFEQIKTPYTREEVVRRAEALVGQPFKHLPGNPPEHKVIAELQGKKLRVSDVEQIYNDWALMSSVYGPDAWDSVPHESVEIDALAIARLMYEGKAN